MDQNDQISKSGTISSINHYLDSPNLIKPINH